MKTALHKTRDGRGALWRQLAADGAGFARVLRAGGIGRLWRDGDRPVLPAVCSLRSRSPAVFGKRRLFAVAVFGLLRRRGFAILTDCYLRKPSPQSPPLRFTFERNSITGLRAGLTTLRPLAVVNNNTHQSSSRLSFHRQQFNQHWHSIRHQSLVLHIGMHAPLLRAAGVIADRCKPEVLRHLRGVQLDRMLLGVAGRMSQTVLAPVSGNVLEWFVKSFTARHTGGGLFGGGQGARFEAANENIFYGYIKSVNARLQRSMAKAPAAPSGVLSRLRFDGAGSRSARWQRINGAAGRLELDRALFELDGDEHSNILRRVPALLSGLLPNPGSLQYRLVANVDPDGRRDRHAMAKAPAALSGVLSRLRSDGASRSARRRQRINGAAGRPDRALFELDGDEHGNIPRRVPALLSRLLPNPGSLRYRSAANVDPGGRRGLHGLFITQGGRADKNIAASLLTVVVPGRALRVAGDTSTGRAAQQARDGRHSPSHAGIARPRPIHQRQQQQQWRAQQAIVELCRSREQQRQEFHRRDERIFQELQQQLRALQRAGSNEQAALLKAVQSLERALTQTLHATPAPAIRPLSFMGNR